MHFGVYVANVGFILAALAVLGGCGWVAVAPFRDRLSYPLLVAPMAGLLCVLPAVLSLYGLLKLSLAMAGVGAAAAMLAASALSFLLDRPGIKGREAGVALAVGLLTCGFAVGWGMEATVKAGGPALVYWDGTDHVGYAHLGDWLNHHRITESPTVDPARPYESWPAIMFQGDPRFGSFALAGLVSAASGESGTFSYELMVMLVHVVAVLAVAGAFARSPLTLAVLAGGLFTCHWFDYTRYGFFGKSFGYPAIFTIVALLLRMLAEPRVHVSRLMALVGLSIGAALVFSGVVTAFFMAVVGGGFVLARVVQACGPGFRPALPGLMQQGAALVLLGVTAVAAGSTLARPQPTAPPDWNVTWSYIIPRIAELESQGVPLSGFGPGMLQVATWITFGAWIFLGGLSLRWRNQEACALLLAPLGLLAVLYAANATAVTFQLIGTFYPLALMGFAVLFDAMRDRSGPAPTGRFFGRPRMAWVTMGIVGAVLGLHLFRFFGATARYGGAQTPPAALFTKTEIEALAAFVGRDRVEVEVTNPQPAIMLLAELGRRGANLQWSAGSWKTILGYRGWAPPQYAEPAKWRIVPAGTPDIPAERIVFRGAQYWVLPR